MELPLRTTQTRMESSILAIGQEVEGWYWGGEELVVASNIIDGAVPDFLVTLHTLKMWKLYSRREQ